MQAKRAGRRSLLLLMGELSLRIPPRLLAALAAVTVRYHVQ
jgi:hypothetical protein